MADGPITDLAVLDKAAANDVLAIVDDPTGSAVTKKIAASNLNLFLVRTPEEIAALVTVTNFLFKPGFVYRYGTNLAPGTTDLTTALQAALDQNNQGGPAVTLPGENVAFGTNLKLYAQSAIIGQARVKSTLTWLGTGGSAFINNTLGTRIEHVLMRDFFLNDGGTGAIGLDLDSITNGYFENLLINGFTTSIKAHTTGVQATNGVLYNRYVNVTAQNATTGFHFNDGSNANIGSFCRSNVCTIGVLFDDCNESGFITSQFESGGTGISAIASGSALTVGNFIAHCHFEGNSVEHYNIGTNVDEFDFTFNNWADGPGIPGTDNGNRTEFAGVRGSRGFMRMVSALLHSDGSPYYMGRTTGGTAPMLTLEDQNAVTGGAPTLKIINERAAGSFLLGERASTTMVDIRADGDIDFAGDLQHRGSNAGFYNTTPIVQPVDIVALTDNSGGTANDTLEAISATYVQAEVQNNFADVAAKINEVRTVLRNLGLMA